MSNAIQKVAFKYICETCDYKSNKKCDYNKHLLTLKHKERQEAIKMSQCVEIRCHCNKIFKHYSSLYRHKKKCMNSEEISEQKIENNDITSKNTSILDKEYIVDYIKQNNEIKDLLLKENKELKNQLKQQNEQIKELIPKVGNNNNNILNQKFNINLFLNEKCKDAMSINDFVNSIEVTLKNLLTTKSKGIGIGINEIISENMNKLSVYERPIHCTDKKRETLYIKNECWEKDTNKNSTTKLLKNIQLKQIKNLNKWIEEHPNYLQDEDLKHEYTLLINKSTSSLNDHEKKLFKNLCENTYLKDENLIES